MKLVKYVKNYSLLILLTAISQLCALLVTMQVAKLFGPAMYGELNLVITIAMFTGILIDFGMNNYFTREVARNKNTDDIISFCFIVKGCLSLVSFLAMIVIGLLLHKSNTFVILCFIWSGTLLFSFIDFRWFFVARQKSWVPVAFSAIGQVIFTLIIISTLTSAQQIIYYGTLGCICTGLFPMFLIFVYFIKTQGFPKLTWPLSVWPRLRKELVPLAVSNICTVTNTYFPPLIIGSTISLKDLGIYSAAYKPMIIVITCFNLITLISTPAISKVYEESRVNFIRFIKLFLFLMISVGFLSSVFMTIIAPSLIHLLFGSQYEGSAHLLKIWTLGLIPFLAISIVFSSSLIPCNCSKAYSRLALTTTVVLVLSTLFFANYSGAKIIPFANVLSEGIMAVGGTILFVVKLKISKREALDIFNVFSSFQQIFIKLKTQLI